MELLVFLQKFNGSFEYKKAFIYRVNWRNLFSIRITLDVSTLYELLFRMHTVEVALIFTHSVPFGYLNFEPHGIRDRKFTESRKFIEA